MQDFSLHSTGGVRAIQTNQCRR